MHRLVLVAATAISLVGSPIAAASGRQAPLNVTGSAATSPNPIPGPRTCFWARGPVSGDPYVNVAYPDSATFYWAATFAVPQGARLRLVGRFPHARYMSLISYDLGGKPIESDADYLIRPDAGSTNPFRPGADRRAGKRSYALDIVDSAPPEGQSVGRTSGEQRDVLHAPKTPLGFQTVLYRIYARDDGTDETGGTGLPTPELTTADGRTLTGEAACATLQTYRFAQSSAQIAAAASLSVPMPKYRELLDAAAKVSPFFPATSPPTWYLQLDRQSLYDIYLNKPLDPNAKRSEGGFFPNLDNQYIRTILNRKLGRVFVVRGKAPTTPHTLTGEATMGQGEMRYWSFCSNQGFANTRVNGCVHDEQVPLDAKGYYTLVVSRAADRPRNAVDACGVAWLPMANDGDGAGDDDVTVLQLRNMLSSDGFGHAVQSVPKPGSEEETMGEYFPRGYYMTTSAFENALACIGGAPDRGEERVPRNR